MMNLIYPAFFLISFIPSIIGYFWYHPNSPSSRRLENNSINPKNLGLAKVFMLFILSFALVYGYINLIIHQMGFYELFFTDLMKGSAEAETIVKDFLGKYGDKHRHFGHGVFHGVINAFVFAMPFVGVHAILEGRGRKYFIHHFLYWLITSAIIGGCISQFV